MTDVSIPDINGDPKVIRTITRGGIEYQVVEPPAVTPYVNLDLDENGVSILGAAGQVQSAEIFNRGVVDLYVKVYDKATAPSAADTPKKVWQIFPGNAPFLLDLVNGIGFSNGIGVRCTTGLAHADTGAPATNACLFNLGYRAG